MNTHPFEAPSIESLAELLPGYDIEALVAQGGTGAVYKAHQRSLGRDVALKVLPRELGQDAAFRKSFESEARAIARLNHPNLLGIYDSGEVDGLLYIVMEFVPGTSLLDSAHGQPVDPKQAVEIVLGICRGLAEAHENGVIHRDLNPANILLTPNREPKIGHFGLARPAGSDERKQGRKSPGYTAPEVVEDPACADDRADLFGLGVILYELLTGRLPEEGCPAPSVVAGVDPQLDQIWRTATAPARIDRYADAEQMAEELEAWLGSKQGAGLVTTAAPRRAPRVGMMPSAAPDNRPLIRNLVIIAVLLVTIVIVYSFYRNAVDKRKAMAGKPPASPSSAVPDRPARPAPREPARSSTSKAGSSTERMETLDPGLIRLRENLASGERGELPEGSVRRGDSDYYLVSVPKTWEEARRFAESFGGQLPRVSDPGDLEWLASLVPPSSAAGTGEQYVWVGAKRTAGSQWTQADGSAWAMEATPAGAGRFAAVGGDGNLKAAESDEKHPFLIQWLPDLSDPVVMREMLIRTKASLAGGQPEYPPGTATVGERRFLVIDIETTFEDGRLLAELGGGILMVPATPAEADWLESETADRNGEDLLWLGGFRDGHEWKWHTGESWTFGRWAPGAPSGEFGTLAFAPGAGWRDADPDEAAGGFVIEWSSSQVETSEGTDAETPDQLRAKAEELLGKLSAGHEEALKANVRTLAWDFDFWLRGRPKGDAERWATGIDKLKSVIEKNRMPTDLPGAPNATYSEEVLKIAREHVAKQEELDSKFEDEASKIRDGYVARLTPLIESERERGQPEVAKGLEASLGLAADLEAWLASFPSIGAQANPVLGGVKILSAIYGTGGKNADVTERVARYVEQEQKSFRVTPGHLGADPNPGWNKRLTITFDYKGAQGRKHWGENSTVEMGAFVDD